MLSKKNIYQDYLDDLIRLLSDTSIVVDSTTQMKKKIDNMQFFMPVIGEFNSGKSSALNQFLETEILPVGITPEIEIAIELYSAVETKMCVQKKDGNLITYAEIEWESIKADAEQTQVIQLYFNNIILDKIKPFILVDMPGINGSLPGYHHFINNEYLQKGVYFLVVISVENGAISKSLSAYLSQLKKLDKPFAILINKIDLKSENEIKEIAEYIREQVTHEFGKNYPVSILDKDNKSQLSNFISSLDINKIMDDLFLNDLKDHAHEILNKISALKRGLKNSSEENQTDIFKLDADFQQLQYNYERILADEGNYKEDKNTQRYEKDIKKKKKQKSNGLAYLAIEDKNQQAFLNEVFRIGEKSINSTLKQQLEYVNEEVAESFSLNLTSFQFLKMQNTNFESKGLKKIVFGVLSKLLEYIAMIIRPLKSFIQDYRVEQFNIKFQQDLIPEIKAQIEMLLPECIEKEFHQCIQQIKNKLENELQKTKSIIQNIEQERQQQNVDSNVAIAQLNEVEQKIKQLTENVLYVGV